MHFENRFLDKFHKETEFPAPRPFTIKRRKSFSDQFFKSGFGSSLKLRGKGTLKLSNIASLKFRQRLVSSPTKEHPFQPNEKMETNKFPVPLQFPESSRQSSFYIPCSQSSSVKYVPLSESVDSSLPMSSKSSVITLSKHKTMKSSSRSKFGTFRRSDGASSPYGSILKGRINKTRPQLRDIDFDDIEPPFCSSPISCNLPLSGFRESSFSSTLSLPSVVNIDSKNSFYGQDNPHRPLARTDYSCRVSKRWGKNRRDSSTSSVLNTTSQSEICSEIESSRTTERHSFCFEDTYKTRVVAEQEDVDSDSHTNLKFPDAFHKELLLKCSQLKSNLKHSSRKDSMSSLESLDHCRLNRLESVDKHLKVELSPIVPNKPNVTSRHFENGPVATREITSSITQTEFTSKPKVSVKPQLLPKPLILPKPDVFLERSFTKPNIPVKPERLKTENISFPNMPEINNNCIILKPSSKTNLNSSLPSIVDAFNENRRLLLENTNKIEQNGIHNEPDIEEIGESKLLGYESTDKLSVHPSPSKTFFEPLPGSKVKNLVASFNHSFKSLQYRKQWC